MATAVTLFADVVEASRQVSTTCSRSAKIAILAELLSAVAPEEVPKMNEHAVNALRTSDPQHGTVTPQNWTPTDPVMGGSVGFTLNP